MSETPLKPVMRLDPAIPKEANGEPCIWGRALNFGARHRSEVPIGHDDPLIVFYSCHPDVWAMMPKEGRKEYRLEGEILGSVDYDANGGTGENCL